ncbi:very-long-chain 3-oxoacyl-CoA reductase isoform X2 [Dasypus novemcinctus]|uniref:very-long-chain 3-oxoacyl-CoA reductase isoform X2 n=2 Tax=Dasypus novemcinctus TaxID=9361 RepID=UPI00265DFFED|nr:very-long-chain 3-oxoacyl-CoA reductase isoform X2 [Dasypus novemcinctus]
MGRIHWDLILGPSDMERGYLLAVPPQFLVSAALLLDSPLHLFFVASSSCCVTHLAWALACCAGVLSHLFHQEDPGIEPGFLPYGSIDFLLLAAPMISFFLCPIFFAYKDFSHIGLRPTLIQFGCILTNNIFKVVTGSTDGIGKAYAEELAKCGMKVVLISRSQDKLNQVSSEIREKFKVETRTIAADFGSVDIYDTIKRGLEGLEIGILVNNVGTSYEYPESFLNVSDLDNTIKKLINVNIVSVCKMTRLVLPGMEERSKGVILNISSISGMYPVPLLALYSASKAFVDYFSQCLHEEYKSKGIFVQSVLPYLVATKLAKIRKATLDKPSSETFVKSALKTVGLQSRTNGYVIHFLLASIMSLLPSWICLKIMMTITKSIQACYLKKNKKN